MVDLRAAEYWYYIQYPYRVRADARGDLPEILDDRHNRKSMLATSQLPVDQWHGYIGQPTLPDAILDRLVHNAFKIPLQGRIDAKDLGRLDPGRRVNVNRHHPATPRSRPD